ncbi:MAG: translation elongation factor Ts [Roseibium album]|uniref:translation elongation factor Ts n=1 Tax=Roseibium album TaxID=311410 RepID=UPI0018CA2188|nr:translation elongation factor Ts [Roseibium album]MBG6158539.1 elongation factor Ts [Labrenzia sp. EL_162]MBG6178521.1 elongation factor Ts [Labrenzia sp. EL_132]MBG6196448.1 elongation factor Ts [Labrenzia sp. EL_159]MBG6202494.1 elongation factor Ts [Labrenzia sp. EL_13]MBG6233144.1 elongation factor Ts [Labrenzia sp. EL_208]
MSITAAMVKELREKSGAGMMDCKTALSESGGDMEAAVDWLRTKGLAKAAKKAGRVAAEGLVGVAADGGKAAVIELNSETDFVARNEGFQELVTKVAKAAVGTDGSVEAVSATDLDGKSVSDAITDAIATIGENMTLRRSALLAVNEGVVSVYVHGKVAEGLGKIGVLVALESSGDKSKLDALGRQIAMHVAATSPLALNVAELDQAVVEREKSVFSEQARESGKPDNIIEKMVEGRLRKFYEEVTLEKQAFVINPDQTVEQAVEALAKELGTEVKLSGFVRFALGEGIEKEEQDFAAEVAAATGQ